MSWDEHIMLIAHTAKKYGNDLLVIGNTGSNSTREALHATQQGMFPSALPQRETGSLRASIKYMALTDH